MTVQQVWYVSGADAVDEIMPVLFTTKMAAEKFARIRFPDEDPDKRYARIFYRLVWSANDVYEDWPRFKETP